MKSLSKINNRKKNLISIFLIIAGITMIFFAFSNKIF